MSQVAFPEVDIDLIDVVDDFNCRKRFPKDELEQLAATLKETGLLQPIKVKRKDDGRYDLVAGERRLRVAEMIEWTKIPATFSAGNPVTESLIENIQRSNLNPVETALGLQAVAEEHNLDTNKKIAAKIQRRANWVGAHMRLLELPKSVQSYIAAGDVPMDAEPHLRPIAYGSARAQEIEYLGWPEVDFNNDVLLLAADEEAKKSEAARRIVPLVRQLRDRLYAEWVRQGEPTSGRVCPPRRADNKSGCISLNALQKRRFPVWEDLDLEPIGLHDSRHTVATWLDHAGVSPKVASAFIGHKAPKPQVDAAPITLRLYTHLLPRELERARDQLQAFLDEREAEEEGRSFKLAVAA